MDNRRNYYRILHVQPDAPVEIIQTSYRTLMQRLKMHPDLGGDHWNAMLINEAYAVLTDPDKRAGYDRELQAHPESFRQESDAEPEPEATTQRGRGANAFGPTSTDSCAFCHARHGPRETLAMDATCNDCGSPLYAADRPGPSTTWMRAVERIPREQFIAFYTCWPQTEGFSGRTCDLSLTGMKFTTSQPVTPGRLLKIESELVSAVARVVYCRHAADSAHWEVGVEFFRLRFGKSRGAFVSTRA